MVCNILDIRRQNRMRVTIHDPFVSNLGITNCLNQYHYPWIIHRTLPFFLSTWISPLCTKYSLLYLLQHCSEGYSAHTAQMNAWKGSYSYNSVWSTITLASASWYNWISWRYMCPSGRYTTYGNAYFSSIDNNLSMNVCNSAVTLKVPNLSSSADSKCCTDSMPCDHL